MVKHRVRHKSGNMEKQIIIIIQNNFEYFWFLWHKQLQNICRHTSDYMLLSVATLSVQHVLQTPHIFSAAAHSTLWEKVLRKQRHVSMFLVPGNRGRPLRWQPPTLSFMQNFVKVRYTAI